MRPDRIFRSGTQYRLYLDAGCRATDTRGVWNQCQDAACQETILCESIINALTFWCAGYRNVTASYGLDGFTDEHRVALERWGVRRMLIAYRRDESGDRAAEQLAAEALLPAGFECFRIQFPHGMDANEYARKITPATQSLDLAIRRAEWMGRGTNPVTLRAGKSRREEANRDTGEPHQGPDQMTGKEQFGTAETCDGTSRTPGHEGASLMNSGPLPPRDIDAEIHDGQVDMTLRPAAC